MNRKRYIARLASCLRLSFGRQAFVLCLVSVFLESCEKNISINLPPPPNQVVIEGHIETGQGAFVVVTRNSAYFAPLDSNAVRNAIISTATVIVSDGIHTDTLPFITDLIPRDNYLYTTYIPLYYKKALPTVIGQPGGTYNLVVLADGKRFTSTTTMPSPPVNLDSVWFKLQPPSDSLGFIWGHLKDPAGIQNYYRWYARRLHKDKRYFATIGSAFNDKFIDGQAFNFAYDRGMEPNSNAPDDKNAEAGYFKIKDTVVVKFCSIDRATYDFYTSYEVAAASNGNPFGAPSNVKTNIQGGGLGVWAGFSTTFDTLVDKPHP
ncbi:MAG: DUF4249 domain-containing protein [Bacteroidia bacterium]